MSTRLSLLLPLLLATAAHEGNAQSLTIRDRVEAVPPISICNDGATHRGACSGIRLRAVPGLDLSQFEDEAVDLRGDLLSVTCDTLVVRSVSPIANELFARPSRPPGQLLVEFFGQGPAGVSWALFLNASLVQGFAIQIPGVDGPFHLDPLNGNFFLGVFQPTGSSAPFASLRAPDLPIFRGVTLYDQVLAIDAGGGFATSNLDCFSF